MRTPTYDGEWVIPHCRTCSLTPIGRPLVPIILSVVPVRITSIVNSVFLPVLIMRE